MYAVRPVQRVRDMTYRHATLVNPQTVVHRNHTYRIADDELHVCVGQSRRAAAKLPLTLAVAGQKLESAAEIEAANRDVWERRALGVVDGQVVYTNSIDLFRVRYNAMTEQIDFMQVPQGTRRPSYAVVFNTEQHFLVDRNARGEYLEAGVDLEDLTAAAQAIVSDGERLCFQLQRQRDIVRATK